MEKGYIYNGAAHKHELIIEEIEDLGGILLDKNILAYEIFLSFVLSEDDIEHVKKVASELRGEIKEAPLLGTEIAVVSPNIAKHHLPNILCDVAEFIRKFGAKTNMIGLARGAGQRTAQITSRERKIIEENDAAVFVVGNFEYCIKNYKINIFNPIKEIPFLVVGGPELNDVNFNYVSGFGRLPYRLQTMQFIPNFKKIINKLSQFFLDQKKNLSYDPYYITPFMLKKELERQILEIENVIAPMPVVCKINGARVKLPFKKFFDKVKNVKIGELDLNSVAYIEKSEINDNILIKLKHMSGIMM